MKLSSNAVETGIYLLRKTGPVGIQEIADPSEIPKESFYNYFPSKDHFLLEVLEMYEPQSNRTNMS
ncbi:TetR/AcrR family transcriptional regulator [Leptospira borgpetersenii]|uniref:Transcriptional regulator, TetR family n=3 Tax=Leptospira borgpetersenii TaxID=174 RepID=M3GTG9_LEPBO|nr:TetR/AcrR family transcriptional regulator [Leptospira borgpetersenii]EMF98108.1 transcriptional regulator, TetR family [Leptospira borgpetersenii str. 200701203]EKP11773.1 transcriptional regulator, TetR family [Leptospira borgpetersenii str. 200801926]EMN11209.1 transcriptional regulator, TetR family [Leptospira borgpetersenii str. Brem 307]EMN15302.1 transcriptional regulator, TetR family [Leptospira borgpetersenii str. Brem 328]ENO62778.1 transcriptional regulator, TetR family [Leptospi